LSNSAKRSRFLAMSGARSIKRKTATGRGAARSPYQQQTS